MYLRYRISAVTRHWIICFFLYLSFYHSRKGIGYIKDIKKNKQEEDLYDFTIDENKTQAFYDENKNIDSQEAKDFVKIVSTVTAIHGNGEMVGKLGKHPNDFYFIKVHSYCHIACMQIISLQHIHWVPRGPVCKVSSKYFLFAH